MRLQPDEMYCFLKECFGLVFFCAAGFHVRPSVNPHVFDVAWIGILVEVFFELATLAAGGGVVDGEGLRDGGGEGGGSGRQVMFS